ncbi:Scr1 family TA system antitoxin-like transcriptional regulator [Actinophytocola sp.]|uniref:Scr1 family TA system antitoxin-like transcriptional regulator n=1 Tax=Actinophytocola sp. TaxID=1872138 RepID=UPI0025BF6300|nr:Scr1 family TA system antitoxin-like transcriptional regulator [Actinophytocola sp.]
MDSGSEPSLSTGRDRVSRNQIDRYTAARLTQQRILDNLDQRFWFILDEAALRRTAGSGPSAPPPSGSETARTRMPQADLQPRPLACLPHPPPHAGRRCAVATAGRGDGVLPASLGSEGIRVWWSAEARARSRSTSPRPDVRCPSTCYADPAGELVQAGECARFRVG